ncbi:uncharacterized protein BHQ10_006457 [Talaromyces amestolkiae]|uniref:FAD-binding domain-containing protein n=1 Tax=Talaromyces amestolkiae TaxID=1196081 RepID=A0A364L3Q0_TALAM|nr:uncharacterized protein BHQ10_006457 [Talaromyces amestolkiae]RAO70445.1 hypothetical protein BHQ10_006457 [Talaromyces amestolkiae]
MDSFNRILIIGAGIGGLALAQSLKRANIPFTVFERDDRLDSRLQGYRLKIAGPMQARVRELLTDEAWAKFKDVLAASAEGEMTLSATSGSIIASRRDRLRPGTPLPWTVDRGMFRTAMMTGIEDSVLFSKQFVRYELEDHCVKAVFADGSVERGLLLVGADGIRSVVRKQLLPEYRFADTGSCCIYGKTYITPELSERFPALRMRWFTAILDSTPVLQSIIFGERPFSMIVEPVLFNRNSEQSDLPKDYIYWGLIFSRDAIPLDDAALDEALRSQPAQITLDMTSEWHSSTRSLCELQEQSLASGMRVYTASPNMEEWAPSSRVTLLGDAIHTMSPAGGVGAMAALHDSATLAEIIHKDGVSESSIGNYETRMRDFSNVCIQRSFRGGGRLLNTPAFENCSLVDV